MLADHRRQLEPVEFGHAHIDQHDRDIVLEQVGQRLLGRAGLDEVLSQVAENSLVAEQLSGLVVDQKDVDLFLGAHDGVS
jgi:hypothetical protein